MTDAADNFRAEYLYLQGVYEDYDKRALSLKALATPLLGAGIAVGFKEASWGIFVATIVVGMSLWVLEALWKSFQYCHADRIQHLEAIFEKKNFDSAWAGPPFRVYFQWNEGYKYYGQPKAWLALMGRPFVMLPYAAIVGVAVAGLASTFVLKPEKPAPAPAYILVDGPPPKQLR